MSADTFRKIHVISMEFHDLKKEEYTASRLVFCFWKMVLRFFGLIICLPTET